MFELFISFNAAQEVNISNHSTTIILIQPTVPLHYTKFSYVKLRKSQKLMVKILYDKRLKFSLHQHTYRYD